MKATIRSFTGWTCIAICLTGAAAPGQSKPAGTERLASAWSRFMRAQPGSRQFDSARSELATMIERLPVAERVKAATALMDRYAPDNINAAAIQLFGLDPFPSEQIRRIVFDRTRSPAQRVLVRTYYGLCGRKGSDGQLSRKASFELLGILCDRIQSLAGKKVGYGEQRLLVHLSTAMLTGFADKAGRQPLAAKLAEALDRYVAAADKRDTFAAAARGWLKLIDSPTCDLSVVDDAVAALGHWDELARLEASASLSRASADQPEVARKLWKLLDDSRDELRAAAAIALSACDSNDPDKLIDRMVKMLLTDRGVVPQAAASAAIVARADQAGPAIQPLLDAFTPAPGKRTPKPKRAASILSALAALAGQATLAQRDSMLSLARRNLKVAPSGALKLLKGLGPAAAPALPQIREYRARANRFERQYIDRHVLPAIKFGKAR